MTSAATLEATVVALLATLPDLPLDRVQVLAGAYQAIASAPATPAPAATLAAGLAALLHRYADRAAPLEGWGLLASAAYTLSLAMTTGGDHTAAIAAACFEIDSLAAPTTPRPAAAASPDVPASSLRRRS